MTAYYNEIEPFAAAWLENLIAAKLIAPGVVDTRSIEDIRPDDLAEFTQCHFFAGIGLWSFALRLAGWPDHRPVWTGSCPCQPFSAAGQGNGFADERHLWPAWHFLIEQRKPVAIFGEQVASKDGLGWFDLVQADLEGSGYAVGANDLCAAGFGAPHIRQRLAFAASRVEHATGDGRQQWGAFASWRCPITGRRIDGLADADAHRRIEGVQPLPRGFSERIRGGGVNNGVGNTDNQGPQEYGRSGNVYFRQPDGSDQGRFNIDTSVPGRLADANGGNTGTERQQRGGEHGFFPQDCGNGGRLADADCRITGIGRTAGSTQSAGLQTGAVTDGRGDIGRMGDAERSVSGRRSGETFGAEDSGGCVEKSGHHRSVDASPRTDRTAAHHKPWASPDWIFCRDNKFRPVEPGSFPLVNGYPGRVGVLRAYGNAIVPQVFAAFIEAACEVMP